MSELANIQPNAAPVAPPSPSSLGALKRGIGIALVTHEVGFAAGNPLAFSPGGTKESLTGMAKDLSALTTGQEDTPQRVREQQAAVDSIVALPGDQGQQEAAQRAAEREQGRSQQRNYPDKIVLPRP